ncbi:hypothetical protein SAMN04487925_110243 [Bradyrhizobium sp. cf659]|nr:hypothetical protein SAMN04487925_110243 [Bradyrhizobium sp. cf659]
MPVSVRFYLFASDGLQRISHRVMEGLCQGRDAMPQFAGTKQKVVNAIIEVENGKPARIVNIEGTYLDFDSAGKIQESLWRGVVEAMDTHDALERSKRTKASKVVDLTPKLNRERWQRENRWTPSQRDLDLICSNVFGRQDASKTPLRVAKGVAAKPPPLTYEAKAAIDEIRTKLFTVEGKLELLSEQSLKGLAFEARRLAKDDSNQLWLGVAEAADRRGEILARHRTGKGTWYASVEIIRWDASKRSGESSSIAHEKCNSKKEAEEAARKLLSENAKHFSAETSVEARVVCDLEWNSEEAS